MSIETMKQALEALENASEYIQAEHDQRKEMYEPYGMVHKYSTEAQNLLDNKQAITSLRQAIEQAEKPSEGGDCDSPSWCKQYGKCHRKVVGAPTLANCIDKRQEPWVWQQSPIKTQWGHDMVVADLAIDKDHTVSVYCERDQTARVEAMFNRGC